ncbi:MAG: Glycosyl transferase group 1 [Parcubacteria group bacterium GW2011_GWA2_36_10]|nr:MAG: Glycosyl transferase group 1 [Parcubacteria group bacterium GW2011_GWA2_36_10]
MPKIALAHDHLFQNGGAERVLAVLAEMFPEAPIFTLINDKKVSSLLLDQKKIKTSDLQNIPLILHFFKYFLFLMPKIWEKTDLSEYDTVISSASSFVKGVKIKSQAKHICYCHAPTRYLWDDKAEYLGNLQVPKFLKIFLPRLLNGLQAWDFAQAQKVDQFIANSQFIADKIKKDYQREAQVIYPPIKVDDFYISDKIDDYFLIVSRLRPYKKVDLAIRAFNNMKLPLKIIGTGSEYKKLKQMASSNIEFLGEVSDEARNKYLSHCQAFLYPQVEDLGISALEAMASGRPVIAYQKGGALETVIDGQTGIFFQNQNWAALTYAVLRYQTIAWQPELIRAQAKKFDISVFKAKISQLLKDNL